MAVPEGLLIAGAIVGLVGGVVGAATGADNFISRISRSRRAKRDAEMILNVEFDRIQRFDGPSGASYPVAQARIFNNGKISAKDIRVESSTGHASIDADSLLADQSAIITFAVVEVQEVSLPNFREWRPIETPYRVGSIELSVTWRIDGTSKRSEPKIFEASYSGPPLG